MFPLRRGRAVWIAMLCILSIIFVSLTALLTRTLLESASALRPAPVARPARLIPNTDLNPYGANFFLTQEVEAWKLDKTLQMAAEAGIGWVKQHFPWEEIEPRRKGEYIEPVSKASSWAKSDAIVAACEKYGLRIVARLDRPPAWSRQDNSYHERPPDNLEDYGDFVYEFVKRYAGRIHYIQVWNEPNIFPEWGNRSVDARQYVELLKVAYRRAKEADPNVQVLCAPLAITLGQPHPEAGKWIAQNDLAFLEEMYQAGAAACFDIYSANAFGMDRPPEDPPDPHRLNFQRVVLHRRIMERYGDAGKAVWFHEYGWNAAPESFPAARLVWQRVSEKEQAEYTVRGIALARREWPWAGVFMIWYFRQVGNIAPEQPEYYFRMVDSDFTPRLSYRAIQEATRRPQVYGPGLYQESSPALKMRGQWQAIRTAEASGGAYLRSLNAGDAITFTFSGPALDLITRRSPQGGILAISLDGRTVPGLDKADLYAASPQSQARLPLVRGATRGEHTVRLTVSKERHPQSSGQECIVDALEVLPASPIAFPVLIIAALLVGLALDVWLLLRTWRRVRWLVRPA
jgi:hypothetical protein